MELNLGQRRIKCEKALKTNKQKTFNLRWNSNSRLNDDICRQGPRINQIEAKNGQDLNF